MDDHHHRLCSESDQFLIIKSTLTDIQFKVIEDHYYTVVSHTQKYFIEYKLNFYTKNPSGIFLSVK